MKATLTGSPHCKAHAGVPEARDAVGRGLPVAGSYPSVPVSLLDGETPHRSRAASTVRLARVWRRSRS